MSDEPRIDHAARLRLMADDLDGLSGDEIRELLHDAADEIDRLNQKVECWACGKSLWPDEAKWLVAIGPCGLYRNAFCATCREEVRELTDEEGGAE